MFCKHSKNLNFSLEMDSEKLLFNCYDAISLLEDPKVRYKCPKCNFSAFFSITVKEHLYICHKMGIQIEIQEYDEGSFTCSYCKHDSFSQLFLLKHIYKDCEKFDLQRTQPRPGLLNLATTASTIRFIVNGLHWHTWYECEMCPFKSHNKCRWNKHVFKHTNSLVDYTCDFECNICSYKTRWWTCLLKHKMCKHSLNVVWYRCKHCSYKTMDLANLKAHCIKPHALRIPRSVPKTPILKCEHCDYKSKSNFHFKRHSATHNEDNKTLLCEFCGTQTRKGHLTRHIRELHTGPGELRWFKCPDCPYKAKQNIHLKLHIIQKHTPENDIKWHKCDKCKFKAKLKAGLKDHMFKKHTNLKNIKWYYCSKCPLRYLSQGALTKHIRKKNHL